MKRGVILGIVLIVAAFVFCPLTVSAGPVPDTGQTTCYDADGNVITCPQPGEAFYGQDAQHQGPPRSYTKLGAGGVELTDSATQADGWIMTRDNVTGLIWEIKTDDGSVHDKDNTYTWYDGDPATNGGNAGKAGDGTDTEDFIAVLNAANYGGYSDWRIPSVKELSSLVNADIPYPSPLIDTVWFPLTVSSYYWSSTTYSFYTSYAWRVVFGSGRVDSNAKYVSHYVRAVRSGQSGSLGDLVINGDGTATDPATGLMWEQKTNDGGPNDKENKYTWEGALAWVAGLNAVNFLGYSDWRLPDRNELQTLVNYSRSSPAIVTPLTSDTVSSSYWSSTTSADDTYRAWRVNFVNGEVTRNTKSYSCYVRAVHSGQYGPMGHLIISSPEQASVWTVGAVMPIAWDTAGLGGAVLIAISSDGGKTYTTIETSTPNDGNYNWKATGPDSVNCMLKIAPLVDTGKEVIQGMFSIFSVKGDIDGSGNVELADAIAALMINCSGDVPGPINLGADTNGDGKIGLADALFVFRKVSEQAWYKDSDGDGYSDGTTSIQTTRPTGYYYAIDLIETSGDCNDNNAGIHPGATEIQSDGIDQDCDGYDYDPDDLTPPQITFLGHDGETGVSVNPTVNVKFNEKMSCASFENKYDFLKYDGSNFTAVPSALSCTGDEIIITPMQTLEYNSFYASFLSGDIADFAGNPMGGDGVLWMFQTEIKTLTSVADLAGQWTVGDAVSFEVTADGDIINFTATLPTSGQCFGDGATVNATFTGVTIDPTDYTFTAHYSNYSSYTSWTASMSGQFTSIDQAEGDWEARISNICVNSGAGTWIAGRK